MEVKILFGTETGNAEEAAKDISNIIKEEGLSSEVLDMGEVSINEMKGFSSVVIVTSTWGDGDAPANAQGLLDELSSAQGVDLSSLRYAVFAIGDSMYPQFCKAGEDFDIALEKLGAERVLELQKNETDDSSGNIPAWTKSLLGKIK